MGKCHVMEKRVNLFLGSHYPEIMTFSPRLFPRKASESRPGV